MDAVTRNGQRGGVCVVWITCPLTCSLDYLPLDLHFWRSGTSLGSVYLAFFFCFCFVTPECYAFEIYISSEFYVDGTFINAAICHTKIKERQHGECGVIPSDDTDRARYHLMFLSVRSQSIAPISTYKREYYLLWKVLKRLNEAFISILIYYFDIEVLNSLATKNLWFICARYKWQL